MKTLKTTLIIIFLTVGYLTAFSQEPPPPPGEHGISGNQGPSDAPITGGVLILISLGIGYGGLRAFRLYQENKRSLID